MPISKKLEKFLENNKIKYEIIPHRTVYTAYDKAQTLKVPLKIVGKTLLVKLDKSPSIVLIPANKNLDLQRLKKLVKAKKADFLKEVWMEKNLKARLPSPGAKATGGQGVKVGAIPPFGNQFKMPTFIDRSLIKQQKIIVNGGDYNFSIKITPGNLKKLTPDLIIGNFSASPR